MDKGEVNNLVRAIGALHMGESAVSRGLAAALNDLRGWLDEED